MKLTVYIVLIIILLKIFTYHVFATENPLAMPNNKYGIHILFPDELQEASHLVNSNGGDWGYVTIPIQIGDRDITKWQNFMNNARSYHLIPIIRIASENDYFKKTVWKTPTAEDINDFANFLDSLNWPTRNRYIIIFNEPNRADEWGGSADPEEYALLLDYSIKIFKQINRDFFIISAGMDNAAPQDPPNYINEYNFLTAMEDSAPGIFSRIDGFASHSYPNPGFAQPPDNRSKMSIISYQFESDLIKSFSGKDLPVFITETGWNAENINEDIKSQYYKRALTDVWNTENIVAITPFLLHSGEGPFKGFSFIKQDGSPSSFYKTYLDLPKQKGVPLLTPEYLLTEKRNNFNYPEIKFNKNGSGSDNYSLSEIALNAFSWIMKL